MEKKTYYVSLQSREISQVKVGNNADFTIYATEDDVAELRTILNTIYDAEVGTFWRSHIPIIPYHHDQDNDQYDASLQEAYDKIYTLGDQATKEFIEDNHLLSDDVSKRE